MWQFQDIRTKAIKAMENPTLGMDLDPVHKIVIARKFDVSSWLVPSLNALVQREKPLDLSDGVRLGMEWALKVAEARECGATLVQGAPGPTCQYCPHRGAPLCSSSDKTIYCGSCQNIISATPTNVVRTKGVGARGGRTGVDYSDKIREIFKLE